MLLGRYFKPRHIANRKNTNDIANPIHDPKAKGGISPRAIIRKEIQPKREVTNTDMEAKRTVNLIPSLKYS